MNLTGTILIVDAGSTKTDWCLIDVRGKIIRQLNTPGINAAISSCENLKIYFDSVKRQLINPEDNRCCNPSVVYYYGAGCATEAICGNVADIITLTWDRVRSEVSSDMLGACRALLGNKPGVGCILGTGSNSALYNGTRIIANTPSLGYILGDEGGGAALGKILLSDIFKGVAPDCIVSEFLDRTSLDKATVIRKVYREPDSNRFLASFARYIADHKSENYFHDLVLNEFTRFLQRNVMQYSDIQHLPVSFIGSIAVNFREILSESMALMNLEAGAILTSPLPGLISYHTQTLES